LERLYEIKRGGNPRDGKHQTFENLFPTNHKLYGYMDFVGWRNIHNPRLSAAIHLQMTANFQVKTRSTCGRFRFLVTSPPVSVLKEVEGVPEKEAFEDSNQQQSAGTRLKTERLVMQNRTRTLLLATRQLSLTSLVLIALAAAPAVRADDRAPDLTACTNLQVAAGNEVAFHVYAIGVQIYQWNGTAWVFVAPAAQLYADAGYKGQVGIHYAGPTWESNSRSKVVGRRLQGCTPDRNSIPWLLLAAVTTNGPGVLNDITFVQRVNTVGGIAPSTPGSAVGQTAQVPYTAEYFFYGGPEQE